MIRFLGTFSIVLFILPSLGSAVESRYAVVDVQNVLLTVDDGRKAQNQLESAIRDRKKDLETQQAEYKKLEENFEKQKLVLSPQALAEKQRELEAKKLDLQKSVLSAQSDMQKKELQLSGEILKKIRDIIAKIGKDGGYDFIWEKTEGGVIYFRDAFDITKQVIDQYNRLHKR